MQTTEGAPPRGTNRKPMKRPDKVVLAERKNKREEARLRMYINYLSKQGMYSSFLVEKEKRQIRNNVAKIQRTSGNSKVGLPPEDASDNSFENCEYFKGGSKISEKSLTRWRVTEKEIERILILEEAQKAKEELANTDMGWLKELFKDFDMDSSSDEDDEPQYRLRHTRKGAYLPDPADVFERLRPDIPPSRNIYSVRSRDEFTVNKWRSAIVNKYISKVSKPPGKITRKMRRPLSEIKHRVGLDHHDVSPEMRPHSAIGLMRRSTSSPASLRSEDATVIDEPDAPYSCKSVIVTDLTPIKRDDNDANSQTSTPDSLTMTPPLRRQKREMVTCDRSDTDPEALTDGNKRANDEKIQTKVGFSVMCKSPTHKVNGVCENETSSSRPMTPSKKEQRVSFAESDVVLNDLAGKPPIHAQIQRLSIKRRPMSAGARISSRPDGSHVTGFITPPILKRQDSKLRMITEQNQTGTNGIVEESAPEIEMDKLKITDSDSNVEDTTHGDTQSPTNHEYTTNIDSKPPPNERRLSRTPSRSFMQSATVTDDDGSSRTSSKPPTPPETPENDGRPRMSQWRRQLRADAPPGLAGNKGEIKTHVTISRSERRRQLREMVENNYLDLQKMITQEKDRRLHSRLGLFVTLLEFHQKRKDDKKKAKEEKRNEQNDLFYNHKKRPNNALLALSTKR